MEKEEDLLLSFLRAEKRLYSQTGRADGVDIAGLVSCPSFKEFNRNNRNGGPDRSGGNYHHTSFFTKT